MIPLMKNTFLNEYDTKKALAEFILKATKFSMDTKCSEFEKAFANFQGKKDGILFNSGGSANLAMFQALKNINRLIRGDKVGFSALTWSTNVMPIIQMGLETVPIDCEPRTLNVMSYKLEERLMKEELKALFITNTLGFAGDLDKIKEICSKNDIILIEDNCEALGTELSAGKTGILELHRAFPFLLLIICQLLKVVWFVQMMKKLLKC